MVKLTVLLCRVRLDRLLFCRNMAPIVSSLKAGVLSYVTKDGEEHVQDIHGGFVEMNDNKLRSVWTEFLISNLKLHIDVSITKRNYLWQITLLTVLIGGIGGWAYYSVFPHHYFGGYPLIPIFFLTFGVFMINMVESCRHRMPGRMLQIYLLMRVMRMLASIIVMLVYCVAVREEAKEFLLTFIVNYLIYLIYDSWFFFTFEANRKLKKKKRKENETIA